MRETRFYRNKFSRHFNNLRFANGCAYCKAKSCSNLVIYNLSPCLLTFHHILSTILTLEQNWFCFRSPPFAKSCCADSCFWSGECIVELLLPVFPRVFCVFILAHKSKYKI